MALRTAEKRREQMVNAGKSEKWKSRVYMFLIFSILISAGAWGYSYAAHNVFPAVLGTVFVLVWFFHSFSGSLGENDASSWLSWANIDEYLAENPQCKSSTGVICNKCSSHQIRANWWCDSSDTRKIHACNSCGTKLFVSE